MYARQQVKQLDPSKSENVGLLCRWMEEGVFDALSKREYSIGDPCAERASDSLLNGVSAPSFLY